MTTTQSSTEAGVVSWVNKQFHEGAGPHMRSLAEALQALCRCLSPDERDERTGKRKRLTQARAAARIPCTDSCLSRYLTGKSLPAREIIEKLHAEACRDAGGEEFVNVTLDELQLLHDQAELERRCRGCTDLTSDVNTLKAQLSEAENECSALRQKVQEQEAELSELAALRKTASRAAAAREFEAARAGSQARPGARTSPGPLPVPRRRRDRQRMPRDVAAVRSLTEQARRLDTEGRHGAALTLLRRSAEVLNPLETAGVLLLLREQQHDDLADNLIHVYGRDQEERSILHLALSLHEQGSADDAGAILQAALDGAPAPRERPSAK
ncbi:hypothetical protein ACFW88_19680 [Streptomyces anandii]|uniref:Uncharacterized protein n=1 Tax=Streptomyces anandii TaxID=285454 RepID=A0ABW6H8F2_9ACTN